MNTKSTLSLVLLLSVVLPVLGQDPTSSQVRRQTNDEDVVRITTNLIQVDAVVMDKNGNPVTDLSVDEFEILENGHKQKITNFSYVPSVPVISKAATPSAPTGTEVSPSQPPLPPTLSPVNLRRGEVQRTIALVVDDLGLSFESVKYVRRAMNKFVDEQMQPGDMIAVINTSIGVGTLQQFTSDKRQLHAAINRVRWNPLGRGGISPFAPIQGDDFATETSGEIGGRGDAGVAILGLDEFSDELFTVGTLGTLNYILQGLKDLPGRKSLMLFSDGIRILNSEGLSPYVLDDLRRLTDFANRASVVIYTIDARGLPSLEMSAIDNVRSLQPAIILGSSGGGGTDGGGYNTSAGLGSQAATRGRPGDGGLLSIRARSALDKRRTQVFESQQGLNYLAEETGGLAIRNTNDLTGGLKKMMSGEQGYYLIGYHPNDETFDPKRLRFNKLTIKVKRSGLNVRYRSGFFGVKDEDTRPAAPATRAEQLTHAINSPFAAGALDVRLTSLFANDAASGSFMRSIMHVDASKLTFTEEPEGWRKVGFDIMAVTFGVGGEIIDNISRTENMRVRDESFRLIIQDGFDYIITVPIRKPVAYQLRAALRDSATERIGSASQFIVVPDIAMNRLALSGLVINGFDPTKSPAAGNATGIRPEPQAGPGIRRLKRGYVLGFGYVIYNAQLDKVTQRPRLQTQIRLFYNGRQIFQGDVLPFDPGTQTDLKRLNAGGRLQLGTEMSPGEYVLQVIVTDPLAKEKQRTASQWIDFQISDK